MNTDINTVRSRIDWMDTRKWPFWRSFSRTVRMLEWRHIEELLQEANFNLLVGGFWNYVIWSGYWPVATGFLEQIKLGSNASNVFVLQIQFQVSNSCLISKTSTIQPIKWWNFRVDSIIDYLNQHETEFIAMFNCVWAKTKTNFVVTVCIEDCWFCRILAIEISFMFRVHEWWSRMFEPTRI